MYAPLLSRPILLVEDSAEDARVTMRAFLRAGLRNAVVVCRDGEEALDYLYQQGSYAMLGKADRPELILLDLNLPGRDGRTLLRLIKADDTIKAIPVIILTTSDEPSDIEACYQYGANSYVKKPVDFAGFMQAIARLVDFWFTIALLPQGHENHA